MSRGPLPLSFSTHTDVHSCSVTPGPHFSVVEQLAVWVRNFVLDCASLKHVKGTAIECPGTNVSQALPLCLDAV